jgi:hypothetical protein
MKKFIASVETGQVQESDSRQYRDDDPMNGKPATETKCGRSKSQKITHSLQFIV